MNATYEKNIAYKVNREAEAARDLIAALSSDDATLRHDMVEGETNLLEALQAAIDEIDESEAIAAGCKDREAVFAHRRAAAESRVARIRASIEQALLISDMSAVRLPGATITVKDRAPAPIYDDESAIPAQFWKPGAPKIDRDAIKAAMDAGQEVPGVSRSNGGISLQIRRK